MKKRVAKAGRPVPGALKSLRVSDGFRDYALDQLSSVHGLRPRPMFGGIGLYAGDVFFGVLAADVLYLKVDDTNRSEFEQAKSKPFRPFKDRPMSMSYYAVPLAVLESAPTLARWAERSIAVARRRKTSTQRSPLEGSRHQSGPAPPRRNS